MKLIFYFIVLLCFASHTVNAQSLKSLQAVDKQGSEKEQMAILYGNFVQRLGFTSGGFAQDIRIMNMETKEVFSFRVKPILKSSKENTFCFYIKPGKYQIVNYWWTESKWYGGKMFTEYIFKNVESSKVAEKIKSGQLQHESLEQYTFEINPNAVVYLGTWHFDKELVSFTNNKEIMDKAMQADYPKINWNQALVALPQ